MELGKVDRNWTWGHVGIFPLKYMEISNKISLVKLKMAARTLLS
jgi:hypothetical protein